MSTPFKNFFKFFTPHKPRHIKVLTKILKFKFSENLIQIKNHPRSPQGGLVIDIKLHVT